MSPKPAIIIACQTVINELAKVLPEGLATHAIESGLHTRPAQLRAALQQAIDTHDGRFDPLILGYGLCAQAVIDLKAKVSTLVIPRVDDCIAILLGSVAAYKAQLDQEPGTYFLSPGWIDAGVTLVEECEQMVQRYGASRAAWLQKEMLKHYKRLAFIDTGAGGTEAHKAFARKAARQLELTYAEIPGTQRLLAKIAAGPWDEDEFVVVRPDATVRLSDFLKLD